MSEANGLRAEAPALQESRCLSVHSLRASEQCCNSVWVGFVTPLYLDFSLALRLTHPP